MINSLSLSIYYLLIFLKKLYLKIFTMNFVISNNYRFGDGMKVYITCNNLVFYNFNKSLHH